MKMIFTTLLLLLLISCAIAQPNQSLQQKAPKLNGYTPKAVFSYRGGFITHHDTVLYLRDTQVRKRTFNIIQLASGELRQVPLGSVKPLLNQNNTRYMAQRDGN